MKKILTSLMLITASFMLLFMVIPEPVHAVPHQEQFTIVKDADFDYNVELYNFLQYAYADYDDGVHPELLVDIDVLTYSTSSVSKAADVFTLTFDTYVIVVDGTTITSTGAAISDGTYVLDFYLEYETYQDLFYETIMHSLDFTVLEGQGTFDDYVLYQDLFDYLSDHLILGNNNLAINTSDFDLNVSDNIVSGSINLFDNPSTESYSIEFGFSNDDTLEYRVIWDKNSSFLRVDDGDIAIADGNYTISFKSSKLKSWTQAHDYGRIRTNSSNLYLNESSSGTSVYLSHTSSVPSVINLSNIDLGDEIVMQSPYSNFEVSYGNAGFPRTILVEQENIAAVKMIKNAADNTDYTFVLYYWESGGITSRVVSNVNLANRNSLNIGFKGGYRKALDNQDAMVANVDELTPLEDFLPYLTAFDAIDGDISDDIVIVNDGGYQPDVVDIYNVEFGVTNSNGLETTLIVPVYVADIVAPVITGVDTPVNISYDQSFNVTSWVNSLSVTDNYYTGLSISILNNSYSSNKTIVGTYEITVQAVDPSGNKGTLTRVINVTDGVGPVFSGIDTITASINENLTVEQIKAGLAAIDAIDGNVTASITVDSDNLTGNSSTPGTYEVIFMAVDAVGNQTFHTVEVTIVTSPPGFYILNSNSIRLLPGASLSIEQILNLLGAVGASEVSTNYNADVPGTYNLSFTVNGESVSISITVLGQNDSPIPTPIVPGNGSSSNLNIYLTIGISVVALSVIAYVIYKKKKSV